MEKRIDFTTGKIVGPLLKFAIPVLFALFLQAMYGAVDLLIVGQFAMPADVSAVSTGSQLMTTLTNIFSSLCMGMTIFIGQKIGEKKADESGKIIGSGIFIFVLMGLILTIILPIFSKKLATVMHAPAEAFNLTADYIKICGAGMIVIVAYNLIGGIFRGLGDSNTPLITVLIACVFNILGDLLLVPVFGLGAKGAAMATVLAQFISVVMSIIMIKRKELPFKVNKTMIKWNKNITKKIFALGTPIALQELLVGASFLVILAIVNSIGLNESAGVGVAEKVCIFIMLVPSSFMQSMSAFVAQNRGAGKISRAMKGFKVAVGISFLFGFCMFLIAFFKGDILAGLFSSDKKVVFSAAEYLKAYAIDCLLTCFLFCFVGFYNGMEYTLFVMIEGSIGALLVRVPVSYLMSKVRPVSLFKIGLAIPCSTVVQIILCFGFLFYLKRRGILWKK